MVLGYLVSRGGQVNSITITVPCTPPSVNTYVRHTRRGGHYKTDAVKQFEAEMQVACIGKRLKAKQYEVQLDVYFGPGERKDTDNLAKIPIDCLAQNGVFAGQTDSTVKRIVVEKYTDQRDKPRTEIRITAL